MPRTHVLLVSLLVLLGSSVAWAQERSAAPANVMRDVLVTFTTNDGTALEGKLTLPAEARGPVPVVFYLHGAGPRNSDQAVPYRTATGALAIINYFDSHTEPLAKAGVAFFRISKRGCSAEPSGRPVVDRAVFSTATPTVLLDDYAAALEILRRRPEIDPERIVLFGSSEGTRLAPQLTLRSPAGIAGLVLTSYAGDNTRATVEWQNSVGPWRNVVALMPAAGAGRLTRVEYDDAVARDASLAPRLPFAAIDSDADGTLTPEELRRALAPRLSAILNAVDTRNDDFLWQNLLNLTSAYLLDGWDGPPTRDLLLTLTVPIVIIHGALDGTTRVEAVEETAVAFVAAGKTNLAHTVYPGVDHDLGWTPAAALAGGPEPLRDALRAAVDMATR